MRTVLKLQPIVAMRLFSLLSRVAILCFATLAMACQLTPVRGPDADTLYQQVGGQIGVTTVVEGLLHRVHGDPRLSGLFENTDLADLQRLVEEQLCAALGGPCVYTGRDMEEAHSGLAITDQEFDWFVEHLIASMTAAGLAQSQQSAILELLGPMRPQVVGQ